MGGKVFPLSARGGGGKLDWPTFRREPNLCFWGRRNRREGKGWGTATLRLGFGSRRYQSNKVDALKIRTETKTRPLDSLELGTLRQLAANCFLEKWDEGGGKMDGGRWTVCDATTMGNSQMFLSVVVFTLLEPAHPLELEGENVGRRLQTKKTT